MGLKGKHSFITYRHSLQKIDTGCKVFPAKLFFTFLYYHCYKSLSQDCRVKVRSILSKANCRNGLVRITERSYKINRVGTKKKLHCGLFVKNDVFF